MPRYDSHFHISNKLTLFRMVSRLPHLQPGVSFSLKISIMPSNGDLVNCTTYLVFPRFFCLLQPNWTTSLLLFFFFFSFDNHVHITLPPEMGPFLTFMIHE